MASSVADRGRLLTLEEVQRLDLKKDPGPLSIFGALDEKRAPCRKQSAQHLAGNQSRQRARHYNPLGPHLQAQEKDSFSPCRYLGPFPSPPRAPQPAPPPTPSGSRRMDVSPNPRERMPRPLNLR